MNVAPAPLNGLALFAGAGMLDEGLRAGFGHLGIETRIVCYVEREAYAAGVLAARMEEGALDGAPVWSDVTTFDGRAFRGVLDFIVGGFPCQDISIAGKRAGLDGSRSGLFYEILRIADECGAWCLFLENVAGITSATATVVDKAAAAEITGERYRPRGRGLGEEDGAVLERAAARVVGELADRGWNAEWVTLSALDVGAAHGRQRWFCFAWRMGDAARDGRREGRAELPGRAWGSDSGGAIGAVAESERARRPTPGCGSGIDAGRELEPGSGAMANAHGDGFGSGRRFVLCEGRQSGQQPAQPNAAVADAERARLQRPGPENPRGGRA